MHDFILKPTDFDLCPTTVTWTDVLHALSFSQLITWISVEKSEDYDIHYDILEVEKHWKDFISSGKEVTVDNIMGKFLNKYIS